MIEGKKIRLRDLQFADLGPAMYWLHPSQKWHELDGPYYPPSPEEELPGMMGEWAKRIASPKPEPRERLAIADVQSNAIMGLVTRYWISKETDWVAIGLSIWNPEHWGKGYGYEALGYWCDYLFAVEPRFVRLDARTWSGNHGMMRLAEKLGFKQEAVFRKARIVKGQYYDGLGYGILREEWEAAFPNGFSLATNQ